MLTTTEILLISTLPVGLFGLCFGLGFFMFIRPTLKLLGTPRAPKKAPPQSD